MNKKDKLRRGTDNVKYKKDSACLRNVESTITTRWHKVGSIFLLLKECQPET